MARGVFRVLEQEGAEETGLRSELDPVAEFPFVSGGVHYTVHCYATRAEGPIPNHDAEWSSSGFRSPDATWALLEAGQLCPDAAECLRRHTAR